MRNPFSGHPAWREVAVAAVLLPVVITLAVLAFAWPTARIAPRDLPVGIVGTGAAAQHAVDGLVHAKPGAFDFRFYSDQQAARSAIEDRDVYGAFVVSSADITVLEASAAGPSVAQLLGDVGKQLADRASQQGGAGAEPSAKLDVRAVDVVPVSAEDPKGAVFSSAVLPLTICAVLIGATVAMARGIRRSWHRVLTLLAACAVGGFGAYLVAQGFLGALPHAHVTTWAVLSLVMISISATAAALIRLLGPAGLGVSAALMVFVGNPFSGVTSAPEMLPKGVDYVGQWLPPGAGASLLRDTAYFGGNSGTGHLAVLILWSVCGLTALLFGRRVTGGAPGAHAGGSTQSQRPTSPPDRDGASAPSASVKEETTVPRVIA